MRTLSAFAFIRGFAPTSLRIRETAWSYTSIALRPLRFDSSLPAGHLATSQYFTRRNKVKAAS
jgi:hypothetical protein